MTHKKIHVLILDDDKAWLNRHKNGLKRGGFIIHATQYGEEAIELIKTQPITFGLIDEILKTPSNLVYGEEELQRWQGRGVIRKIREYRQNINFAFITAAPTILSNGNNKAFKEILKSLRVAASGIITVINKDEIYSESLVVSHEIYDVLIDLIENRFPHSFNSEFDDIIRNGCQSNIHLCRPGIIVFKGDHIAELNINTYSIFENQKYEENFFAQANSGDGEMISNNQINFENSNIGGVNIDTTVHGNQVGHQQNDLPNRSLAEAAQEIQDLLETLEKTYPSLIEADNQTMANTLKQHIELRPKLKAKILSALHAGGAEAFKQLFQHPAVEIVIAALNGWNESGKGSLD